MTENVKQLASLLEKHKNDLWQLQNAVLQLWVETSNRELAAMVAKTLEEISRAVEPAGFPALLPALSGLAERFRSRTLTPDLANNVLELVEALVSLPREGEGPLCKALESLGKMPGTATVPAQSGPAELADQFEGIDVEDLKMFCAEASEHLQNTEGLLVSLEKTQDPHHIAEIFRAVHSIKGGAQYIGLTATATLAHRMETLLDQFRKGEKQISPPSMSVLLKAVDGLVTLIRAAEQMRPAAIDVQGLVDLVDRAARGDVETGPIQVPRTHEANTGPIEVPKGAVPPTPPAKEPAEEELSDLDLFSREYTENASTLKRLSSDLEAAARNPESVALMARALHSIKGIAGFIGLGAMEKLSNSLDLMLSGVLRHRSEIPLDVRRALATSLELLDEVFHAFREGKPSLPSVEEKVSALDQMREREDKMAAWTSAPRAGEEAFESDDILLHHARLVGRGISRNDASLATEALDSLEDSALLQGYDELAEAASDMKKKLRTFSKTERERAFAALQQLLPAGQDILGSPEAEDRNEPPEDSVFNEPARDARETLLASPEQNALILDTTGIEGLDSRILADDFDQDLVRIYLDTTLFRITSLRDLLVRENLTQAAQLLKDLAAASSYMGYEPLMRQFEAALRSLESKTPDLTSVNAILDRVSEALERFSGKLAGDVPAPAPTKRTENEIEELNRIFLESARTHLGDLYANILALPQGADADRIASIQHHLSCLHSAATNIGRDDISALVENLQAGIEVETAAGKAVLGPSLEKLIRGIQHIYEACGLNPPPSPKAAPRVLEGLFPEGTPPTMAREDLSGEPAASKSAAALESAVPGAAVPGVAVPARAPASVPLAPAPPVAISQAAEFSPAAEESAETARSLVEAQTTVRVDTMKIDDLMNMVAELVVNRSSFMALSSNIREIVTRLLESGGLSSIDARDLRSVINRYDEATTDLGRVSNQLQEGVMRIRMMPVKTLFSRVPRLVRDLAIREGRAVRAVFAGEETELDKTVIEQLSDPLVHLIRNAISHGIEPAAGRVAAGKPVEGTLRISANHQGNMVIIEVADDGRGIDLEGVRRTLVSKGISPAGDAGRLTQRELLAALFLPGFSTSQRVSDVSGRGVGLDVVKRNIEGLGGQIDVASDQGKGCRFTIRIPLTMAILQALLVKVDEEIYSIPVSAIIQAVKATSADITTLEGQEIITVRNRVIPLVRLRDVFDYGYHIKTAQLSNGKSREEKEAVYVVILQGEGREIGIVADTLIGGQDLVIKSLDDELVDAEGVAGAAILGDGTVTLILDVAEIQKMAIDKEHYQEKKLSDTLRVFERYVRDHSVAELPLVN